MQYTEIQNVAKKTMEFIKKNMRPGMTLLEIRTLCERKMMELGADSFWYWDVGAFVFAGDETTLSVSGKEYTTSRRGIAENDIITIDLSPQNGDTWGENVSNFKEGMTVKGIVRDAEKNKNGIFIELTPNLVGMTEYTEQLKYGQTVDVCIKKISPEKKKVKLTIV